MRRVVIIGAGLAGLSAAASLAARGVAVTVLEARDGVGGVIRRVCAGGARVDIGPTILTDLAPLRRLFDEAGASLDDRLTLTRLDPGLVATFAGGARIAFYADPARMPAALAPLGPHAAEDWRRFLDLGARAQRLAEHYYGHGDVGGLAELVRFVSRGGVTVHDVGPFARRGSLAALLAASIRTPELRRLLAHFARFIGLEAASAPAVALVIPFLCATAGVWYPRGGTTELADAVATLARERGAVVELGERVERLECRSSRVTAAVTGTGRRVPADRFISAIDVAATARLARRGGFRVTARLVPTMAAHVAWWVFEGRVPHTAHHLLHFGDDLHDEPTYIATPTATDPHIAPLGLAVVYALVHRPAGTTPPENFTDRMAARVTAAGCWPPGRVVASGVAAGSEPCYGYAIGRSLLGTARPSQRVRGLDNLVLAGGSVFPGPGLSNVVRSGLRAAALVHRVSPERAA